VNGPSRTPRKDVALVRVVQGRDKDKGNDLLRWLGATHERGVAVLGFLVIGEDLNRVDTHA